MTTIPQFRGIVAVSYDRKFLINIARFSEQKQTVQVNIKVWGSKNRQFRVKYLEFIRVR